MIGSLHTYFRILPIVLLSACSAAISPSTEAPQSALIDTFKVPFDRSKPRYLVYIGNLKIPTAKVAQKSWGKEIDIECTQYAGNSALLTYSMMSALGEVENLSVLEQESVRAGFKRYPGEIGPFEITAVVTEFNSLAEVKESGNAAITRIDDDDSTVEILGKAIGATPFFWVTALTGIPTEWSKLDVTGVIGLDIAIIDPRSRQVLSAFPVQGRFSSKSIEVGNFLHGYHSTDSAGSVMEGAIRVAFQDAAKRIFSELIKIKS